MKLKINIILCIVFWGILMTGCGTDDAVYLESSMSGEAVDEQDTGAEESVPESETVIAEAETEYPVSATEASDVAAGICYVYICGAVRVPGVYEVPQGSRIFEVVQMAGGLTEEASNSSVNQAEPVHDGQMVFLPTRQEAEAGITPEALAYATGDAQALDEEERHTDSRVDINTATQSELMTLPGIGQTKAERILEYRATHGNFSSAEEIMNVDGIKEGLYNRIKDDIRVK